MTEWMRGTSYLDHNLYGPGFPIDGGIHRGTRCNSNLDTTGQSCEVSLWTCLHYPQSHSQSVSPLATQSHA